MSLSSPSLHNSHHSSHTSRVGSRAQQYAVTRRGPRGLDAIQHCIRCARTAAPSRHQDCSVPEALDAPRDGQVTDMMPGPPSSSSSSNPPFFLHTTTAPRCHHRLDSGRAAGTSQVALVGGDAGVAGFPRLAVHSGAILLQHLQAGCADIPPSRWRGRSRGGADGLTEGGVHRLKLGRAAFALEIPSCNHAPQRFSRRTTQVTCQLRRVCCGCTEARG